MSTRDQCHPGLLLMSKERAQSSESSFPTRDPPYALRSPQEVGCWYMPVWPC